MLYAIIIAAIIVFVLLKKKSDNGGAGGSSDANVGSGQGDSITLPIGTMLYQEQDGQLIPKGIVSDPLTVTPLKDAVRPDYRYFLWTSSKPPRLGR
jgi:hypothetical protein